MKEFNFGRYKEDEISSVQTRFNLSEFDNAVTVIQYLQDFQIDPEKLSRLNILDIGPGRGEFKTAIEGVVRPRIFVNFDIRLCNPTARVDVLGDSEIFPFPNETFDLILAHCSLGKNEAESELDFEKRFTKVLQEIYRISSKNGLIKIYPADDVILTIDRFVLRRGLKSNWVQIKRSLTNRNVTHYTCEIIK